jgi:hypothetical protein
MPKARKGRATMKRIPVTQLRCQFDVLRTIERYACEGDAPVLAAAILSLGAELRHPERAGRSADRSAHPVERGAVMRLAPAEHAPSLGLYPEPIRYDVYIASVRHVDEFGR